MSGNAPSGWYRDPAGVEGRIRYFDGLTWTDRVRDVPARGSETHPAPEPEDSPFRTATTQPTPTPTPTTGQVEPATPAPSSATQASQQPPPAVRPGQVRTPFGLPVDASHPFGRVVSPAAADRFGPQTRDTPALELPPPAPGTTQSLLAEDAKTWRPRARPTWAEAGWYPDPGRSRKLRFYDGAGWTARTQLPLETQLRALPKAAVTARARLLEIADEQATRSDRGQAWRSAPRIRVEQPQSLRRVSRGKSGRVGGMLSMAAIIAAVAMLMFAGWQQFAADDWADRNQRQLREVLAAEFAENGGEYDENLSVSSDPTPVEVDRPQLPSDPQPSNASPNTSPPPAPVTPPKLNDRPDDISPFPPAGWSAPANRKIRNLDDFGLGSPVGRLVIPRMNLDEVMVSGIGSNELAKGPGVARYGMLPGSPGNAIVAGHRTGWGEPFRHLDDLRYGDQIIIEIPGQDRVVYEVRSRVIVGPTNTNVVEQTEGVRLTLTTCDPVGVNTHRMIVQAEMIEGPWLDEAVNRSKFRTVS